MKKSELIKYVALQVGMTHTDAEIAVNAVRDALVMAVNVEGRVALAGLGVFTKVFRAPRRFKNPQTGEIIDVPASNTVRFKPSVALKEAVNS